MSDSAKRILRTELSPDYIPEIAIWIWSMQEVRKRTLRLVDGLDQRALDWEGPDGRENSIGSLLYHIGLAEMGWLYIDIGEGDLPADVAADYPHPMATDGRLARVMGVSLEEHLARLQRSRALFLDAFKAMTLESWRRLRTPSDDVDYTMTPEWAVFHLVEHEAGHAFQIAAMKKRVLRA